MRFACLARRCASAMCAMCYQGTTCARVGHVCTHGHSHKSLKIELRVLMKQKVRWHRTKTLGGTGLVTRFYMAGTETLCGGSPAQRCVVSGYPSTSSQHFPKSECFGSLLSSFNTFFKPRKRGWSHVKKNLFHTFRKVYFFNGFRFVKDDPDVIPYRTSMKTGSPAMKKMKKDEEKSMGGPGLRTTQKNHIMTPVFILQNCG